MIKHVTEQSIEELLAGLELSKDGPYFRTDNVASDVLTFCNTFNFVPGTDKIQFRVLYRIYRTWSKKPTDPIPFATQLHEVFNFEKRTIFFNEEAFKLRRSEWVYFYSKSEQRSGRNFTKIRFDAFISYFNLVGGTNPVNFDSIYLLYTQYANEKKKKALISKPVLKELCSLYFKQKDTRYDSYFYLSDHIWTLLIKEIYDEKEKSSKEPKKSRKIPSLKART